MSGLCRCPSGVCLLHPSLQTCEMRGAPTRATSSNGLTLAALLEALKSVDTFLPRRPPRARLIVSASLSDGQIYRLEAPASFRFDADDTGIRWAMNQATFDHIRGDLRLGGHDFADALESGFAEDSEVRTLGFPFCAANMVGSAPKPKGTVVSPSHSLLKKRLAFGEHNPAEKVSFSRLENFKSARNVVRCWLTVCVDANDYIVLCLFDAEVHANGGQSTRIRNEPNSGICLGQFGGNVICFIG